MSTQPGPERRPARAAAASSSPAGRTGPRATSAERAARTRWKPTGRAPGAAPTGSLPASRRTAGGLCTDCAGGLGDFTCEACGREGIRYRRGACGNCVLAERLAVLLDDGTGRIRRELAPFADGLCQMKRPRGGMTWIGRPHVQEMLRTWPIPARRSRTRRSTACRRGGRWPTCATC